LQKRDDMFGEGFRPRLTESEAVWLVTPHACGQWGAVLMRNGREPKTLQTLVGAVTEWRGGVRAVYPLDEALGLEPRERLTLRVREHSLWAVAEVSEEKARAFWEKLAGLAVSRKKIHQLAWEEGDCLRLYWSSYTLQHDGSLLFRNTTF